MKTILKLEELGMFLLGIYLFSVLPFSWRLFFALFLVPDIGMLGYLINPKAGAFTYNLFHHKGFAILLYITGIYVSSPVLQLSGSILFTHAAFDRILGYGLKYEKGFIFTHLGNIGNKK